jgi:lipid II:glycine glycyltransferase (peptidoglycan interpeptide bridge formation enzyme)
MSDSALRRPHNGSVVPLRRPMLSTTIDEAPDAPEWDAFLAATPGGDLVQTSAWARVKRTAGLDVVRHLVHKDGTLVGGAQLLVRRVGPLGHVAYAPYGPVIAPDASDETVTFVVESLRNLCAARSISALIVQPPEGGERSVAVFRTLGFGPTLANVAPSATLRLDLRLTDEELLGRMSKHTRREFRRSLRDPVAVRFATRDDLPSFHALYCATASRQNFTPWSLSYVEAVWDELRPKGQIEVLLAQIDGTDVAGNMVSCFRDVITGRIVGFDSSRVEGRIRPNEALKWGVIQWGREHGYNWLDVGGAPREDVETILRDGSLTGEQTVLKMRLGGAPVLYPEALQLIRNPVLRTGYRLVGSRKVVMTARRTFERRLRQSSAHGTR